MKSIYEIFEESQYENYLRELASDQIGPIHDEGSIGHSFCKDYILENLNTHDKSFLKKKLEEIFGELEFEELFDESIIFTSHKLLSIQEMKQLGDMIKFYGYYIFEIKNGKYVICPTYSTNSTSYIYNDCRSVCFHLAKTVDVKSIMKTGLRCKNGRYKDKRYRYRYFPDRIYVIAVDVSTTRDHTKLVNILKHVIKELKFDSEEYSLLKIDLRNSFINFYHDDMMNNKNTFFTYTNIPASCIKDLGPLDECLKKHSN